MDQPTAEEALRRLEPLVGEWTFEATWPNGEVWQGGGRDGEPFSQRFIATFSDDGNTMTARWEIAEDGTDFTTDFGLVYRRVATNAGNSTS